MKLIQFINYPEFTPMINPNEMLTAGVFGGAAFKLKKPLDDFLPKMPWEGGKWGKHFDRHENFFNCEAAHDHYTLEWKGQYWTPLLWFEWYAEIYYNQLRKDRDIDLDKWHITRWLHYLSHLYTTKQPQILQQDPKIMQALLELGYDGTEQLIFDRTWMQEKYPLFPYPPPISGE